MSQHSSKFVWHDLVTSDVDAAKRFYGELLGWKFEGSKNGPYEHITAGDQMIGGVMKLDKPGMPPHWLGYVDVPNVDSAVEAVKGGGGKIYAPKMNIADVGEFAVAADPLGAVFAPFKDAGKHPLAPESNDPPPRTRSAGTSS